VNGKVVTTVSVAGAVIAAAVAAVLVASHRDSIRRAEATKAEAVAARAASEARKAKSDAERQERIEAERAKIAEQRKVDEAKAAKERHERDLAAWEETYRVYAPLADLLQMIEADRQQGERKLKVQPYMASQEHDFVGFMEYVQYSLVKIKDVLISGKTDAA